MKLMRRSSGSTSDWTDANEHDPGITILVLLVYSVAALLAARAVIKWRSLRCADS